MRNFSKSVTDVMILKIFTPKNLVKMLAFLLKLLLVFAKKLIITLVFEKRPIFRQKLAKIAENCDHRPRLQNDVIYVKLKTEILPHTRHLNNWVRPRFQCPGQRPAVGGQPELHQLREVRLQPQPRMHPRSH
jgi:hypothetical protein